MANKPIKKTVMVVNPETGVHETFVPSDDGTYLPDWAAELVTNPQVFEDQGSPLDGDLHEKTSEELRTILGGRGVELSGEIPKQDLLRMLGVPSGEPEEPASEPAPPPPITTDGVPDGTVDDVLEWVGDDRDRAQQALDNELTRPTPRTTLVEPLEELLTQ